MALPLPLAAMLRKQMFTRMPDVDGVNRWIRSDCIIQRYGDPDKGNPGHRTIYVSITKLLGKEPQATTIYLSTSKELVSAIKALGLDPLYVTRSKPKPEPDPDQLPLEIPTDSDKLADWLKEQSWVQRVDTQPEDANQQDYAGALNSLKDSVIDPASPDIIAAKQVPTTGDKPAEPPKTAWAVKAVVLDSRDEITNYDQYATRRLQAEHNAFKSNLLRLLNDPEIVNALREALREEKR